MIRAEGVEGTDEGVVVDFEHPANITATSRYATEYLARIVFTSKLAPLIYNFP
jgi:hypothetical protein